MNRWQDRVTQALEREGFLVHSYESNAGIWMEADFFDEDSASYQTLSVDVPSGKVNEAQAWHHAVLSAAEGWFDESFLGDEGFTLSRKEAERIRDKILLPAADAVGKAIANGPGQRMPSGADAPAVISGIDGHVRDWYTQTYPDDELGRDIDPSLTFGEALQAVSRGGDFYDALGVTDSMIRERVFNGLSEQACIPQDAIYDAWLHKRTVSAHPSWISPSMVALGIAQGMIHVRQDDDITLTVCIGDSFFYVPIQEDEHNGLSIESLVLTITNTLSELSTNPELYGDELDYYSACLRESRNTHPDADARSGYSLGAEQRDASAAKEALGGQEPPRHSDPSR